MSIRIIASLALAVSACMAGDAPPGDDGGGGGGGGGGGTGGGFGPKDFISAFAMEECVKAHSCRALFPADAGVTFEQAFGATVTACEAMAADYYNPDAIRAAVSAGRITYNPDSAQACLASLDFGTCQQYFTGTSPLPPACDQALVGTIPDGGACTIDLECGGSASWCGDAGTCVPIS